MRIIFIPVFIFIALISNAQTDPYLADLTALKSVIEKMPSFKAQITGEKLTDYNALFNRLASDTLSNPNSYEYFL